MKRSHSVAGVATFALLSLAPVTGMNSAQAQGPAEDCAVVAGLKWETLAQGGQWHTGVMPDLKMPALPQLPDMPPIAIDLPQTPDLGIPRGTKIGMYRNCTSGPITITNHALPAGKNKQCVKPGEAALIVPPTGRAPEKPIETKGC